jgi:hypothetical protein
MASRSTNLPQSNPFPHLNCFFICEYASALPLNQILTRTRRVEACSYPDCSNEGLAPKLSPARKERIQRTLPGIEHFHFCSWHLRKVTSHGRKPRDIKALQTSLEDRYPTSMAHFKGGECSSVLSPDVRFPRFELTFLG